MTRVKTDLPSPLNVTFVSMYFHHLARAGVSSWAGSEDTQAKMWAVTCDMLGIGTFGQ